MVAEVLSDLTVTELLLLTVGSRSLGSVRGHRIYRSKHTLPRIEQFMANAGEGLKLVSLQLLSTALGPWLQSYAGVCYGSKGMAPTPRRRQFP